jgi:hypothetical protein
MDVSGIPRAVRTVVGSSGHALDDGVRSRMELRFHHDFSRVRVHTDAAAAESAAQVAAEAYTVGRHIVFNRGRYAPGTTTGQTLLAHELTHTLQQDRADRSPSGISRPGDADELEADRVARAVTSQSTAQPSRPPRLARPEGSAGGARLLRRAEAGAAPVSAARTAIVGPVEQTESSLVKPLRAQDLPDVFRLDTVTIVQLSASWCHAQCERMRGSMQKLCEHSQANPYPFRVQAFFVDVDPQDGEGNPVRSPDADVARAAGVAHGACMTVNGEHRCKVPQPLMFVERRLVEDGRMLGTVEAFEKRAAEVIAGAPTSGAATGAKIGLGIGAVVGGIAGAVAGGAIASQAGGAVLAGGALGGLLGALGGGLIGAGLGALFGAAFGKDRGTAELSAERLKQVQRFASGDLPSAELDDDMARDVADYFAAYHDKGFELSPDQRRELIRVMIEGFTGDADERAIIKLLENSTDAEILQIFAADKDLRLSDLEAEFDGEEREYLVALLDRLRGRFPTSAPVGETRGLLIDRADVKAILKRAFEETHMPGRYGQTVLRECCGILMEKDDGSIVVPKEFCGVDTACPAPALGYLAARTAPPTQRIMGSYHTHPKVFAPVAREAPSRADFATFVQRAPFEGWEHYLVGPFNVYLILWDGSFRVIGNTPAILGVPATPPPPGVGSALELG